MLEGAPCLRACLIIQLYHGLPVAGSEVELLHVVHATWIVAFPRVRI